MAGRRVTARAGCSRCGARVAPMVEGPADGPLQREPAVQLPGEPTHSVAVLDRASCQPVAIRTAVPVHADVGERGRREAAPDRLRRRM